MEMDRWDQVAGWLRRLARPGSPGRLRRTRIAVAGLFLLGVLGVTRVLRPAAGGAEEEAAAPIRTLAVLSPTPVDPDPRHADLATGLHRSLIEELARSTDLSVISMESALRFQESGLGLDAVSGRLGAQAVVRASLVVLGDSASLSVNLTRGRPLEDIAAWTFEGTTADLLQLQGMRRGPSRGPWGPRCGREARPPRPGW
jgi:TolB-like protein